MSRRQLVIFGLILIVTVIIPLAGCASPGKPLDNVSLQLNWYHAAEFIGYYMADVKGYYREAGISVKIGEGGPGIAARNYILDGRADFAVASFDEQKKLLEDKKPSVAVMTVFQIPPLVMFSLADSGINDPQDLVGKRIGVKNTYWRDVARKTLTNAGIDPTKVIEVQVPGDAQNLLYERKVDVWMGYAHDEPITAEVAGYKVVNIYPADYGVGGYEGLLIINESLATKNPGMVGRFVRASQRGLQYAMEHPDESAQILTKWRPKESLKFCQLAVKALIPLVDIPQSRIGWIDAKRWEYLMGPAYDAQYPGYTLQFLQNK